MNYDKFHVIAVISNPCDYKSRYKNYKIFEESILRKCKNLWTVELSTGARCATITRADCSQHIQLWQSAVDGELWHKEQLINIAVQFIARHCPDFRYVMWTDADFLFEGDAIEKTIQALQTWPVVQAWSDLINLDPDGQIMSTAKSFMKCRFEGEHTKLLPNGDYVTPIGAPGGAWAFRREYLNMLGCTISGPILDFGIVGSGDHYFAHAVVGEIDRTTNPKFHPNYNKWLRQYAENSDYFVKRNVGYVTNTVRHLWHGSKQSRGYNWRGKILIENQFDPETDLTRDVSGLWRLVVRTPRQMKLRDDLRMYFRSRKEDATTL